MNDEAITVFDHGSEAVRSKVVQLRIDTDFGKRTGSSREIYMVIPPRTAFSWHLHTGMEETLSPENDVLLVKTLVPTDGGGTATISHTIKRGEKLTVSPNTPHLVVNEGHNILYVRAVQTITV